MDEYREVVAWIIATFNGLGIAAGGVYIWWRARRKERIKDDQDELETHAIPYRKAFRDLKQDLLKSQEMMVKLQSQLTEALVKIARLEAENVNCLATTQALRKEIDEMCEEAKVMRAEATNMRAELALLRGHGGPGHPPREI